MPLGKNIRYRVKTTPSGAKIRLAFTKGGEVMEAKNLDTGATHTPQEFAEDRAQAKKRKGAKIKKAMMGDSSHTSTAMR